MDAETIVTMTVRDLVEGYPATLSILAPLGIDLCCGGAFQLGEALNRHGIDNRDEIIGWIARAIGAADAESR